MPWSKLHIETFCLGEWMTNCYVVRVGQACWIVDAGFEPQPMLSYVREQQLQVEAIVLTHAHVDHIAGLHAVRAHWPAPPLLIHEAEEHFLTEPTLNLSIVLEEPITAPTATGTLAHGQTLELAGVTFHVRHTPGHSPGGICLHQPDSKVAIVGDTLFAGSIGRFDFPTSDGPTLLRSIREQLLTLPDETKVLPGHGPATTIARERAGNPYLQ